GIVRVPGDDLGERVLAERSGQRVARAADHAVGTAGTVQGGGDALADGTGGAEQRDLRSCQFRCPPSAISVRVVESGRDLEPEGRLRILPHEGAEKGFGVSAWQRVTGRLGAIDVLPADHEKAGLAAIRLSPLRSLAILAPALVSRAETSRTNIHPPTLV